MMVSSPHLYQILQQIGEEELAAVFDVATVSFVLEEGNQEGEEVGQVYKGEWVVEENSGISALPTLSSSPLSGVTSLKDGDNLSEKEIKNIVELSEEIKQIREGEGGIVKYKVRKAKGFKCGRCWRFVCAEGMDVCPRCAMLI